MTRWRAFFTDGTSAAFDVVEVPFPGEASLWRAGEGGGALASSPERAASFWAASLLARCSIDGDHTTGLREIVPPGEVSRAEMAAERDRYREAALTSDSDAEREAITWADRVVALEAERDRLRTVADAARAYVEGGEFSCDDVRTEAREALTEALEALRPTLADSLAALGRAPVVHAYGTITLLAGDDLRPGQAVMVDADGRAKAVKS